jgi:excinuclease ABC subunit A
MLRERRYVESLSLARQFLGRLDKPKVEYIKGIAPAIGGQKVNTTNARSTVGTSTEIYDYMLFAQWENLFISGQEVKRIRLPMLLLMSKI